MNASNGLSSMTMGALRRAREGSAELTQTESELTADTEPTPERGDDLLARLSSATAAKLAGRSHEPVLLGDYELERLVGIGGMGQVFAARSLTSERRVALKILHRSSAGALLGLKREFRVLAEVEHPNLVDLDALVVEPGVDAFFTMELVHGTSFVEHVRGRSRRGTPPNLIRLRHVLAQLVSAVEHLHAHGYVHRDLKPSNVLVTGDARVVVLDFGLVDELDATRELDDAHVVGTPAYMAPEQAAFEAAGPPADVYAIGVMLFESLCGERPFAGSTKQVLDAKLAAPAPDPGRRVPGVDAELLALCRSLLERDPADRPSAREILDVLRRTPRAASPRSGGFVGRNTELSILDEGLARAPGRPIVYLVHGRAGSGKSSLLAHWRGRLAADVLVLRGRCLERESVPYKGFDAIVDALSSHLCRLPDAARATLRPSDVAQVVRLFPVLEAAWPERSPAGEGLEGVERRERAISGLRELLTGLARRRAVVVVLDDFHWADTDSSSLVVQLLAHAAAPPLVVVVGFGEPTLRAGEAAIERLRELDESAHVELHELALGPLSPDEARELVSSLLDADGRTSTAELDAIVRDGAGNPLHLRELARGRAGAEPDAEVDLDRLIVRRLRGLEPGRAQALTLAALAGGPVDRAALLAAGCRASELDALISDELLRTWEFDAAQVEVSQDRIARLAIAKLDHDELPGLHLRLASALLEIGAPSELLAEHYERGGQLGPALVHAEQSALEAIDALAFRRAATWLERCLAWLPVVDDTAAKRRELERRLVDAYVNSGRLAEGAELLLAQAADPDVDDAHELRQRAVEYLLRAGHMQAGVREASAMVEAVGLALPRHRARMIINVIMFRRRLAADLARLDSPREPANEPALRERMRVCQALANGFLAHDGLMTLHFMTLWRRQAIELDDRPTIARVLGIDATFCSTAGWRTEADDLLRRAREMSTEDERAHLWLAAVQIHTHVNFGEFARALEIFDAVLPEFERTPDAQWERVVTLEGALLGKVLAGRCRDAISHGRRVVELGVELGDLRQVRDSSGLLAWALACAGELDECAQVIARVERLEREIVDGRYLFAEMFRDFARLCRLLRIGDTARALDVARELPAKMKREGLWYTVSFKLEALSLIGRARLQAWRDTPTRRGRRRIRRAIRRLAAGSTYRQGNAAVLDAGLAEGESRSEDALASLAEAEDCFARIGADAHLAAVRSRRAQLLGGDEGRRLQAEADAYFEREQIVEPDGLVRLFAPGPFAPP